jgi:predicted amidohydrolase YtcJ
VKLTGLTIVDARARPRPGTVVFDRRIEAVPDVPAGEVEKSQVETTKSGLRHLHFPLSVPVIVPGLIDSHTHPLEAGLQLLFVDMRGASSVAEVQQLLRDRHQDAMERGMMLGFNLEPDRLIERRYPQRGELDEVIPEVPVFIYRVDGHSAVTNTAGLQLVLAKWPGVKPPGMDGDCNGRPTGVLRGEAYERASRIFKHRLATETVREALQLAGRQAATRGVTTIGALVGVEDTDDDEWRALLEGLAACEVGAVPYLQTWDAEVPRRFGLKQAGGCLLIDGSFGSRTAALNQAYSDAPGNSGTSYVSDEKLLSFLRAATAAGMQATVHAIGDRAVEQVVRCHEQLLGQGPGAWSQGSACDPRTLSPDPRTPSNGNPLRHRIEHAELLSDSLIARIAELGLVLGVQPAFEAEWGGPDRMYALRLGERWRSTNPYRRLLDSGVRLAGGSDAPITPIDPVAGIRAAIEHPNANQTISGVEALAMFTSVAAFALNREDTCGSIEIGKDADITVLTSDPRTTTQCQVVATLRGGKCVYKNDSLAEYLQLED